MGKPMRKGNHTTTRLTCHIVWVTKYRYHVLKGDIQKRCRELVIQVCDVEEVEILKGVVSKDHVHIHIEYPPRTSISQLVKRMKGRTSRILQKEFPTLKNRYWGPECFREATGYGAWSTGNITDEMVEAYLEHHRSKEDNDDSDFILE
ncbi:MAG: IS200/IS605 family transposase [Balneolaceae bacterium]